MQESGYYFDPVIINYDFNFYTSNFRALKSAALQSL